MNFKKRAQSYLMGAVVAVVTLFPWHHLSALAGEAEFEACREKLVKAQQIDLLYDMKWDKGKLPYIVVGSTFFTIPFDAKEGFAKTISCFLTAGDADKCINFALLDYRTNKPIADFKNCKLKMK
jgi:hypothetical protein